VLQLCILPMALPLLCRLRCQQSRLNAMLQAMVQIDGAYNLDECIALKTSYIPGSALARGCNVQRPTHCWLLT
jgi:hypothetical protein